MWFLGLCWFRNKLNTRFFFIHIVIMIQIFLFSLEHPQNISFMLIIALHLVLGFVLNQRWWWFAICSHLPVLFVNYCDWLKHSYMSESCLCFYLHLISILSFPVFLILLSISLIFLCFLLVFGLLLKSYGSSFFRCMNFLLVFFQKYHYFYFSPLIFLLSCWMMTGKNQENLWMMRSLSVHNHCRDSKRHDPGISEFF